MTWTESHVTTSIENLVEMWKHYLGLGDWQIDVSFDEYDDLAGCDAEPRYHSADLYFNLDRIINEEPELEELVIHELIHIFTWRLWAYSEKILEAYAAHVTHPSMQWTLHEIHEEAVTALTKAVRRVWSTPRSLGRLPMQADVSLTRE